MQYHDDHYLWCEKYRPRTINDCVLSKQTRDVIEGIKASGRVPNLILSSPTPGTGKSTLARSLCEDMGVDYIMINASLDANLDMIRNTVQQFASTVSLSEGSGQKVVIWDELDHAPSQSVQPAMRSFIEEFANVCSHIITCNYKHRIIEPIISRCQEIDMAVAAADRPAIAKMYFDRACKILTAENVKFSKEAVAELITRNFPDFRRVLNTLQKYGQAGVIDGGILHNDPSTAINQLIAHLKDKEFTEMRRWVVQSTIPQDQLYQLLFDRASKILAPSSVPELVLLLAKYQYQEAFVVNKEINTVALLTELMVSCEFV